MQKKLLLLISKNEQDKQFCTEICNQLELDLKIEPDFQNAADVINRDTPRAIFADGSEESDYRNLEQAIQEKVGLFSDRIHANAVHFISAQDLQTVKYLFESPLFGSFIWRNFGDPAVAGRQYARVLKLTFQDRAFGLEGLLPKDAKVQVVQFNNSNQKQNGVEAVKNYLLALKFKSRMATVIANAVDELVMNAMFDAPVDELGRQIYISTPRNAEFELKDKAQVEMHVGFDGDRVAIMARDNFGSLDKRRLFEHISKRYVEEEYKIKKSTAGAGIGLATVFRSGGSFLFSSEGGVRTEVTVFFKRTDNFREFKDQFRFISSQFYF